MAAGVADHVWTLERSQLCSDYAQHEIVKPEFFALGDGQVPHRPDVVDVVADTDHRNPAEISIRIKRSACPSGLSS